MGQAGAICFKAKAPNAAGRCARRQSSHSPTFTASHRICRSAIKRSWPPTAWTGAGKQSSCSGCLPSASSWVSWSRLGSFTWDRHTLACDSGAAAVIWEGNRPRPFRLVSWVLRTVYKGCTPDAQRLHKLFKHGHPLSFPCASGVHPLYTAFGWLWHGSEGWSYR